MKAVFWILALGAMASAALAAGFGQVGEPVLSSEAIAADGEH